jgi:hypothetical protein
MESLRWLMNLIKRLEVQRLILNGSFTTDEMEPNDVDCVLLVAPDVCRRVETDAELQAGLPYLEIDVVDQDNFDFLSIHSFPRIVTAFPRE